MTPPILIIDDDPTFNNILVRTLDRRGLSAIGALDSENALRLAREHAPERVVLDLNLGGISGLQLIPCLLEINATMRIVVLTGYGSIATAVEAVKRGATQYLAKPVDIETILAAFADDIADEAMLTTEEPLSVDRMEWEHIQRVLNENEGNISATARALKMHRRTLQRKLSKHPVRA